MWVLGALAVTLVAPGAEGQIDPERRTSLQIGATDPVGGDGPLGAYGFLLVNRPHVPSGPWYTRLVVSPVYATGEIVRDRWPAPGLAVGVGLGGGFFAANFDEFREGEYHPRESFWGHPVELALSGYFLRGLRLGPLPLEGQVRVRPQFVAYARGLDTDRRFRLPADSLILSTRAGLRLGGVPPELLPRAAAEVSLWYEASYREAAGAYGRPQHPVASVPWAQAVWGRAGAIVPLFEGHTATLFVNAGIAEQADELSAFRLGGTLPFRREFPLLLHGYAVDEVFARRFVLLNAAYRVPLPVPVVPLALRLSGDWALVDPLPGHALPRRSLLGLGADLGADLGHGATLVLGYGAGLDAAGTSGRQEVYAFLEVRF